MSLDDREQHISRISTIFTMVERALGGTAGQAESAQRQLIERYTVAVRRYLLGALRNPDAADDLFQEFFLRFLRGDFKRPDPERGRFRNYLKTVLVNLVIDYHKRQYKQPVALDPQVMDPAESSADLADADRAFLDSWREELMDRTWTALADLERRTGRPQFTVLRFRADHPLLSSAEMADQIGSRLGKAVSVDWVRQVLHRAREKFTELLLEEVAASMDQPTREQLEQELTELGLLAYCKSALEQRADR
jgi:RNA polymerase sigma-70 factor (ECF subfamily)